VTTDANDLNRRPKRAIGAHNYEDQDDRRQITSSGIRARFGLPTDFIPRFQRHGRLRLLEENIYSLPDGKEFVPCSPKGTLAGNRHLYALLTVSQFEHGQRGSVFIRLDGRVFDYSTDHGDPTREIFDTGYMIQHLERTGRYASPLSQTRAISPRKQGAKVKGSKAGKA